MKPERVVLAETLIAVTSMPETLAWRNNTGQGWQGRRVEGRVGQSIRIEPGMVILRDARPVKFGLEGSGDIIGSCQGRPLSVEVKPETGQQRKSQILFERAWVMAGGIYVLARDANLVREQIETQLLVG